MPLLATTLLALCAAAPQPAAARQAVPKEHPRLFGTRRHLAELARTRAEAYARVVETARGRDGDTHAKLFSMGLVAAIENDRALGRAAVERALAIVRGPIKKGHAPFGCDLACAAVAYDLCHAHWTEAETAELLKYIDATVDANRNSETHVFHNGWYGYKNWGLGLAAYATYHENPRAPRYAAAIEEEFRARAAPALELAGAGGGFGEGYYIHYWLYEWLVFCEAARTCEGVDYYAMAPSFFRNRAVASMFEMYPGIGRYGSRRPVPMGDGGGRVFGGDRDKALAARRILVNRFRDDPAHQAVHAFNETTPRSSVGVYAYMDFLWRDTSVVAADYTRFKLSHFSPGPGYIYARSSWDEDAVYFFFKCGGRFTAHQHLDLGHFNIYAGAELAGDGGHYDEFGSDHDVNYHLRTIAHSTILVLDPDERWPAVRAGRVTGNDGGQAHDWPHHNGAAADAAAWERDRAKYDIGAILAFEDNGAFLYAAGDASRAYRKAKLEHFTRQILYLRPGTFVIFDRVKAARREFKKTWLLQAMKPPAETPERLVITNGAGRLFVQCALPRKRVINCAQGSALYAYGGRSYPPARDTGPAPECRIEVSPAEAAAEDFFLNILTATDASAATVPEAQVRDSPEEVVVRLPEATIAFTKDRVGGTVEHGGKRYGLAPKTPEARRAHTDSTAGRPAH